MMALNNLIFSLLWSEYERVLSLYIFLILVKRRNPTHIHLCTHRFVQSMPLNKSPAFHNPQLDDQIIWSFQQIAWHFIPALILRFHADYTLKNLFKEEKKVIHNFSMHLTVFRHFFIISNGKFHTGSDCPKNGYKVCWTFQINENVWLTSA